MSHWATQYIGRPWVAGSTGPESFDCWGLVQHLSLTHYGRTLPEITPAAYDVLSVARQVRSELGQGAWREVSAPAEGDIALLAHARHPSHCGLWIAPDGQGGVLHCLERVGVVFQRLADLSLAGWGRITFWRAADA